MQRMVSQSLAVPPVAPRHWRRRRALVAALLLALTLAMPLLCVAHCRLAAGHQHAHTAGAQGYFLCELIAPAPGANLFVPAFWPGLLPALPALLIALLASQRLSPAPPLPTPLAAWAPLTPPPRAARPARAR